MQINENVEKTKKPEKTTSRKKEKEEKDTLKWVSEKVGKVQNSGDDADLENILRASENDVYPISIYFS